MNSISSRSNLEHCLLVFSLLLIWQGLAYFRIIKGHFLPSPVEIVLGLKDLLSIGMPPGHPLHNHIRYSLYRVVVGFTSAGLLAIPLGLIRPIPSLAWIPIAILWFGIGIESAAFIIFLGAFFSILLNTISGVLSIDQVFFEAAQTLNAKSRHIFPKVLIPECIPSIFVGMRIGMGLGWMTLVAAELTGVRAGYTEA